MTPTPSDDDYRRLLSLRAMHPLWDALERDPDGGARATPHPASPPQR
jgi:hypothetical protein